MVRANFIVEPRHKHRPFKAQPRTCLKAIETRHVDNLEIQLQNLAVTTKNSKIQQKYEDLKILNTPQTSTRETKDRDKTSEYTKKLIERRDELIRLKEKTKTIRDEITIE